MGPADSIDQIVGILDRHGMSFERTGEADSLQVTYEDVTIFVGAKPLGESVFVHLWAHLAIDVEMTPEVSAGAYVWVNQQNSESPFAKFVIYQAIDDDGDPKPMAQIDVECDLLADELQAAEFINSLSFLGISASESQAHCIQLFGGVSLEQKLEQLAADAEEQS